MGMNMHNNAAFGGLSDTGAAPDQNMANAMQNMY